MADTKLSALDNITSLNDADEFYVIQGGVSKAVTWAALYAEVLVDTGVEAGAEVNDVASVFSRTGAVVAAAGDYAASEVTNDSGVSGTNVDDALNTLEAVIATKQPIGELVGLNTQTGTTYTLVLTDAGKIVEMNNASANTLTVPPNSSVAFPVNTVIHLHQYGAGQTTTAQGAGVTIRTPETLLLRTQYSTATLRKRGTDEWVLSGDLEAA